MGQEHLKVLVHPEIWGRGWHPSGQFELAVFSLSREAQELIEIGRGWLRSNYRENDIPHDLAGLAARGMAQLVRHQGKEYLLLKIREGGEVQASILDPKKIKRKFPKNPLLLLHCLPFPQQHHLDRGQFAHLMEKIRGKKGGSEMV